MLTRATRRRNALRIIEHAADQLHLPWLCPALEQSSPVKVQKRTTTSRPVLTGGSRSTSQQPLMRTLASAAPAPEDFEAGDDYLPFAYERQLSSPYHNGTRMMPYDLSQILMMDHTTLRPIERLDSFSHSEVRGNAVELEATLEACLQVARWDRAFSILSQIRRVYAGSQAKLQSAYNRVLEAMVFDLVWNRNRTNLVKINRWIEVDMREAGVDPDAHTFALKIKAALATLDGSRRDRTVRRYWEMAKDYEFENQVASLRNILSDSDLGKLTEICPLEIDFDIQAEPIPDIDEDRLLEQALSSSTETNFVRETEQKGLGLLALKKALALFSDPSQTNKLPQIDGEADAELISRLRQRKLEQDSMQSAVERWRFEHEKRVKMGVSGNLTQGKIGALLWQWHEVITSKIKQELDLLEEAESAAKPTPEQRIRCEYGPFLRLLDPQLTAALTSISVMQIMNKGGVANPIRVVRLVTELGRTIQHEVESQKSKSKKSVRRSGNPTKDPAYVDQSISTTPLLHESNIHTRGKHWTVAISAKVGAVLCEMLFDTAKVIVPADDRKATHPSLAQPAFQRQTIYQNGRKVGTVTLHPYFQELLAKEPAADLIAKQMPMISKPKPWTSYSTGGYLEAKQPVLRIKFDDHAQRDYAKAAAERGDLDQLFSGLDVLGSTPWRINRNVFNVMLEAWNSGEAVANLPPVDKVFPDVPKPADDASAIERWRYYSKMRAIDNEKGGLHSNRCFQNFQMEIAQAYRDQVFYLPHNVDFRGRAYPIPPYLNQMGADNARGLLLFATGRELGSDGLKWLKVHLSNVYGYDKASLEGRAQFATDHISDIMDSAQKPLTGQRWWLEAEDPWQCLAACHELVAAMALPDPSKFVSHLPIHQDGTCNGLQHYAALGGDIAGAKQVNLEPGDKPADIYTGVAELVKAEIRKDAEAGVEIAKLLDGRLTRKIVKQTVMTNVYGVTFTGAIRQVRRQVDDILPDLNETGHAGAAATYIARKIFAGLGTLFEGAHEIQYWLGDCAQRITHSISPTQAEQLSRKEFGHDSQSAPFTKSRAVRTGKSSATTKCAVDASNFRSTVIWTTPLKLPVVQPYRVSHARMIETNLQNLTLAEPSAADAVDPRKQLQGFPPNFVHSLDATHMMLSAIKAKELGLTFSAVHDSFWTHAADINSLNILLRDEFIRMHSEDIIGRLRAEFEARYKGHLYLAKIGRNNVLAKKIAELRKATVATGKAPNSAKAKRYNELVREIERMRLLSSEDPEEQARGEEMITPASLFEQYKGEQYLPSKVSLGQTAIGEVPPADLKSVADALDAPTIKDEVNLDDSLDPLLQTDRSVENISSTEASSKRRKSVSKKTPRDSAKDHVWLWLPLTFKAVPEKGEFDVRRLKDSTYFFS